MEKAKKYVMSKMQSEDNYVSADPYFAIGSLIILGVLSLASLVVNLTKKAKTAITGKKNRQSKIAGNQAQAVHA